MPSATFQNTIPAVEELQNMLRPHDHRDGAVYMCCIWNVCYRGIVGYGRRGAAYCMAILYRDICVNICMYVRTYICVYICMYVRTYICVYICMYLCTYVSCSIWTATLIGRYIFSPGATTPPLGVVFDSPLAGFSLLAYEVS